MTLHKYRNRFSFFDLCIVDDGHIKNVKGACERVYLLGALVRPRFRSSSAEVRYVMSLPLDRPFCWQQPVDPLGRMPSEKDERAAEATRRMLPEVRKLDRYERRAFNAKHTRCANSLMP